MSHCVIKVNFLKKIISYSICALFSNQQVAKSDHTRISLCILFQIATPLTGIEVSYPYFSSSTFYLFSLIFILFSLSILPACLLSFLPSFLSSFLLLSLISLFIGRYSFCWKGGWESCFKLFFGWHCESSRSTKVCATDTLKEWAAKKRGNGEFG